MVKIAEANHRLFHGVFVCRKCKSKMRADPNKIRSGSIKCRKCNCKAFRPKNVKK